MGLTSPPRDSQPGELTHMELTDGTDMLELTLELTMDGLDTTTTDMLDTHTPPGEYPYASALVAHPNGAVVPAEPADVVAARAEHLAAHGAPVVAPAAPVAPYYAPGFAGLVAHPNGALVPAEPADVVAAREAHLAAH